MEQTQKQKFPNDSFNHQQAALSISMNTCLISSIRVSFDADYVSYIEQGTWFVVVSIIDEVNV